eukprot:358148-Chlamydomonas_euryale.AAC.2
MRRHGRRGPSRPGSVHRRQWQANPEADIADAGDAAAAGGGGRAAATHCRRARRLLLAGDAARCGGAAAEGGGGGGAPAGAGLQGCHASKLALARGRKAAAALPQPLMGGGATAGRVTSPRAAAAAADDDDALPFSQGEGSHEGRASTAAAARRSPKSKGLR